MAMAQRRQRGLLDPDAAPGESVFDHHVWVLASDGDLMEGVASEASSLAGHQELGNLTVVYDANQISIEDDTDISFSEDVAKRYEAYGWEVVDIDWRRSSNPAGTADYTEDVDTLLAALEKSQESRTKPTLVRLHTVIAWPAPTARGTGKSHGSALGADEIAATKELLGFDPDKTFEVDRAVLAHTREVKNRGRAREARLDAGDGTCDAGNDRERGVQTGCHSRNRRLHVSRAGEWTCRGFPLGPVFAGSYSLRNGHGKAGV